MNKVYAAQVKTLSDADGQTGLFEAYVSIFNNVDLVGDRVMKGAFEADLKAWRKSGDPIPVAFQHDWSPFGIIGWADPNDVTETGKGLKVRGHLDILTNPTAMQVYTLMKRRILKEFSFSYEIVEEKEGKDGANELIVVKIIEVGPALKGANPRTELLSVKSAIALTTAGQTIDSARKEGRELTEEESSFIDQAVAIGAEDVAASLFRKEVDDHEKALGDALEEALAQIVADTDAVDEAADADAADADAEEEAPVVEEEEAPVVEEVVVVESKEEDDDADAPDSDKSVKSAILNSLDELKVLVASFTEEKVRSDGTPAGSADGTPEGADGTEDSELADYTRRITELEAS